MADLPARVDALEKGLVGVARLTAATAKGQGKERSGRLVLCFASGEFRERVLDLLREWDRGAAAARSTRGGSAEGAGGGAAALGSADSAGTGTGARPPAPEPLKMQLHRAVVDQLIAQGVTDPVKSTLQATPTSALEACNCRMPDEIDASKPFIFTLLYRPNLEGLAARGALDSLAVKEAVSKKMGAWPPLGIKPGRFLPGVLHREVLTGQLGYTEDTVREWFKGKGQGKGGKPGSGGAVEQLGSKRGAEKRLSLDAAREPKRR